MAQDVGKSNVQCNTVALGLINQGTLDFNEAALENIVKQYPLRRLGKVDDVTGMILFLLSEKADWILWRRPVAADAARHVLRDRRTADAGPRNGALRAGNAV